MYMYNIIIIGMVHEHVQNMGIIHVHLQYMCMVCMYVKYMDMSMVGIHVQYIVLIYIVTILYSFPVY